MTKTRRLTEVELDNARKILHDTQVQMETMAGGDAGLFWAVRRYIYKQLQYGERGTPMQRRKLKGLKRKSQSGNCAMCKEELPVKGAELDRLEPMKGYTEENTRLICHKCHRADQEEKGYT